MTVSPLLSANANGIWCFHDKLANCLSVLNACLLPSHWRVSYLAIHQAMCTCLCLKNKNKKSQVWSVFASLTPWYGFGFPKACSSNLSEPYHWCQAWDFYYETPLQRPWNKHNRRLCFCATYIYIMNSSRKTTNLAGVWKKKTWLVSSI